MLRYLLSNGLVGSACGQAYSSDPRGRADLIGKGIGKEGVLSDVVPALFILPDSINKLVRLRSPYCMRPSHINKTKDTARPQG